MKSISLSLALALLLANGASAQDAAPTADPAIVDSPPAEPQTTSLRPSYEEVRRTQLTRGIHRTRTALIATSASLAVGIALVVPAFTSNNCVQNDFNDNLNCTTTGKALLGVGLPFLAVGFYGMIVSGIMFGVRRGKVRRIDEKIAYESRAKIRWDPRQSKFVF